MNSFHEKAIILLQTGRSCDRSQMINRASIAAAARRIAPHIRTTPVIRVDGGAFGHGQPVTLKLELLQHTGSFKPRGAFNRMLGADLPKAGIIAASGGNHGAAAAYAAKVLGLTAEIFVPATTPTTKLSRIASHGARVVQGGANYAEALDACRARAAETGAMDVHAYDHADIISGQGTVGLELEGQAQDLTHILVATGGGGLIGGIAAWYAGSAKVISVEPEGCPTLFSALRAGHPVPIPVSGLAADALGAREAGALMFPIAQEFVADAVLVTDEAIAAAQHWLWAELRIVAEPGGAAALAALMSRRFVPPPDARIGVVVCGGNTDPGKVVSP